MEYNTVMDLFVHELQSLYNAENQIYRALPPLIKSANSSEFRIALENHLIETKEHMKLALNN